MVKQHAAGTWKPMAALAGLVLASAALAGLVTPMALSCPLEEKPVGGCYNYTCSTATGMWVRGTKKSNGSPCNDGRTCTIADKCTNGVCLGTAVTNVCCSSGTPISTNACCDAGSPLTDTPCSDGDACTQSDSCQAGVCVGSNPIDTANCGRDAAGACRFTTNQTSYCHDKAGNVTATMVRTTGSACVRFVCP